jgi:hypothetical protein
MARRALIGAASAASSGWMTMKSESLLTWFSWVGLAGSPCGALRQAASAAAANDPDMKPRRDSCPLATGTNRL